MEKFPSREQDNKKRILELKTTEENLRRQQDRLSVSGSEYGRPLASDIQKKMRELDEKLLAVRRELKDLEN